MQKRTRIQLKDEKTAPAPKIANVCSTGNRIIGRATVNSTYQNQMKIK